MKNKTIKNKKGIFFTTLVIIILSLFLITFTFYSQVKGRQSIQKRIETMNKFIFSVEQDIPRQLHTSGFRIIFLFGKRIAEKGEYISNLNSTFEEVFFNGTIYEETNPDIETLMTGATFPDIMDSLKQKAQKINVNIDLLSPTITINQVDPWSIKITLTSNLIMQDKSNLALWNKTSVLNAFISIKGFDDPLYTISTGGNLINKINQTPYDSFDSSTELLDHTENSYYLNSTDAPSFLNRLEGINSPSENGIESLIYIPNLPSAIEGKSIVDHIYFSNSPLQGNPITGMPEWFLIDTGHQDIYQLP